MADIQKYTEIVKKELAKYMASILEKEYDKTIFDELFEYYVNIRYYDIDGKKKKKEDLRKVVLRGLDKEKKKLLEKYDKQKVIYMLEMFEYIIYFDNVGSYRNIENIINPIIEFRKYNLNKKDDKTFAKAFSKLVEENTKLKQEYIEKFEFKNFKLTTKKLGNKKTNLITLKYNINFPEAYKKTIIDQIYNSGVTKEDRLLVEYNMLNAILLKDIIKGQFNTEYLVEFATSLLKKKSKLSRVLKILYDENNKERINLLIDYKEFTEETKNEIYSLMRQGYKIAVRLEDKDELNEQQINRLNVFSYVLINDKSICYNDIIKVKELSKKIIKI